MRLLMFRDGAGRRLGALRGDDVVDLGIVAADLLALIDQGEDGLARAAALLERPEAGGAGLRRLADLELLPPLDPPRGNVVAIGRNYARHAREAAAARGGQAEPGPPTIFTKAITTIAGPHADIAVDPAISEQ